MPRSAARASKPSEAPAIDSEATAVDSADATFGANDRAARRPGTWWTRRSLRARLTAAAGLIILIAMTASAVLLVLRLQASLLANVDTAVTQQVDTVATEALRGPLPRPLPTSGEGSLAVQVISASGRTLTTSNNIDSDDATNRLFNFRGRIVDPTIATVRNVEIGDNGSTYRVAALIVSTPSGPVTVYAGLPTTEVRQSVTELVTALAVGVPVVVALLVLVGWLLIGRALRPVEAMRLQAAAIPGTDLHRRLNLPAADDELGRLAATLNELLRRIEAATGRQRQFVADAAHELRSPLAALRTELEVAVRHPGMTATAATASDMLADITRLSRLVDDLLQLARLDANPRPARHAVDLDDLLLDEVRRAGGRNIRIDSAGISAGQVSGDPHALGRVTQNLIDNALRHAASTVTLQLGTRDGVVTLSVADDGPGISPADRDRVFERFTRLDDARDRDAGGAGLGLAIVRDVITAHGGQVHIEDNHPGARFTITLPAAAN